MKDFRMLMKRKHKMFPDNKRIVVNFKIKERRDYRNIFVLSSPSSDQMKEILAKYNKPVK
ncbi:MAG: hypothetical protein A2487_02670 [Candidatus Raymondbacteria bacterium RifOxyC12_full_50_8]|uniref:Uncharacterized protein n=1 Tax=Candidatus Raymondbacteria bacterium RIFOXYD12_FULL_49_13 TaxID=1817890 RepID=A0A1F7F9I2_UNCRA|nr:MAG: hypothetical protein A2248_17840 [Candidatus Raymondbacteria bacterium RIFOXYA2_FULL_49_16]OGJ94754.1 MAG: hypothetical protein A2487_02670 [Candidatus Raymondbacteria bacterium RifOxyC12_full_50_8]OGK03315.1 MAG: hypothetical protein A2519_15185 [Candidatus Raymondbacteria bacterium RIFOXYD12_FULL_49_13]OGP44954.1 MAG: hypothetical protein A2324_19765 [Candidatus Raymondbacteria bacterium RIFOXYB2_FULL_49_35]